jgi:hypothetical protein
MPTPAAPVITSVTLVPDEITVGEQIAVTVEWTGFPVQGVSFQWRRGTSAIADATGPVFTPTEAWADLNCSVSIDNGRGTASGASAAATVPETDGTPDNAMTADGEPMTAGDDFLTAGD